MVYSMPSWIMALPDRFGRLESAEDPAPPRPSFTQLELLFEERGRTV